MAWSLDARIPLTLVEDAAALAAALAAGPKSAVLAESPAPPAGGAVAQEAFDAAWPHAVACACCGGRPPPRPPSTGCFKPGCAAGAAGSTGCWPWPAPRRPAPR